MPKEMPNTSKYRNEVEELHTRVNSEICKLKEKQSYIADHLSMMSATRATRAITGGYKFTISDIMDGVCKRIVYKYINISTSMYVVMDQK